MDVDGRSAGFATSFGVCAGILGRATAAGLGISTLLANFGSCVHDAQAGGRCLPDLLAAVP